MRLQKSSMNCGVNPSPTPSYQTLTSYITADRHDLVHHDYCIVIGAINDFLFFHINYINLSLLYNNFVFTKSISHHNVIINVKIDRRKYRRTKALL